MTYFGLQTIKILAFICGGISCLIALSLIINGARNRRIWADTSPVLGNTYWRGFDFAIGVGVTIIIIHIFGGAGVFLNGYGMLVIYLVLLVIMMLLALIGMVYFMILPWTVNMKNLDHRVRDLVPEQLSLLERNFHCCGIEKYTDYFMIWKIFLDNEEPNRKQIEVVVNSIKETTEFATKRTTTEGGWWGKKNMLKNSDKTSVENVKKTWKKNMTEKYNVYLNTLTNKSTISMYAYDNQRHIHPSARFRYTPDSIYLLLKKYSEIPINMVKDFVKMIFDNKEGETLADSIGRILYGVYEDYYKGALKMLPEMVQDIINGFVGSVIWWTQIIWRPFWNVFKWWRGSGWDDLFWKYVQPSKGPLLPYSCCKIPQVECRGSQIDTWEEGCIYMLQIRWQIDVNRLVAGMGTYLIASFVDIGVVLLLINGIRQKYYF